MSRIELPSGGWAEIRDPKALTERQRRPIRLLSTKLVQQAQAKGFAVDPTRPESANDARLLEYVDADLVFALEAAGIEAFVSSWSFGFPPSADTALDLDGDDYDALKDVTTPLIRQTVLKADPSPSPDSPTGPSSASGPHSEGSLSLISVPNGVSTASFS